MIIRNDLLPPSGANPRNSEGSMVKLANGDILFAYTHFTGGPKDDAASHIAARRSNDGGKSWTGKDEVLVNNEAKINTMSVSFLRLKSGDILLGYITRETHQEMPFYIRRSSDEGMTWSDRLMVTSPVSQEEKYFIVNNERMIQISAGRIIVPAAFHPKGTGRGRVTVFYSDDNGNTWKRSKSILDTPDPEDLWAGLQEPGVVELKDGKLLMWMRTELGSQLYSYSKDKGETWSEPVPSFLLAPCSPASIKRIPSTGDLLVIFNELSTRYMHIRKNLKNNHLTWIGERTPLIAAISKDEGKTWQNRLLLEDDPEGWFCYTSILFSGEKVILSYAAEKQRNKPESVWGNMRITILDLKEIYDKVVQK
ncbi:MAG: sialidase family protein [Candidatus Firestonebacteria bacterium]